MLTFALKKKRTSSIAPKRHTPTVSPMTSSLRLQQAKVRHILRGPTLQPKLTIGQLNDKYEQEADRVADEVMRMPEPAVQRQPKEDEEEKKEEELIQTKPLAEKITPLVQRQVVPEEEEEEEQIQPKSEELTPEVTPNIESRINALWGGGRPLSKETRAFFEPRFGQDFSGVRVHTDSNTNQLARNINARAFTRGKDIVLKSGEYRPESLGGKRLLGHELAHVVQQNNAHKTVQRWSISKNEAVSNKSSDTLWGLSRQLTGSGMSWPCIRPVKMKSKKATGKHYYKYVRLGDKFDITNLHLKTGPSVNFRIVKPAEGAYEKAISKFYNGTYVNNPEAKIMEASSFGLKPIKTLVLSGHTGGTKIWSDGAFWDVAKLEKEESYSKETLEGGMLPRQCWLTRNAKVRIVGCCSKFVASAFAKAFLRKGARAIGATQGICGWSSLFGNFMTFDKVCAPQCPWPPPPAAKRCYSAACMNTQKDKWKIIKGKL